MVNKTFKTQQIHENLIRRKTSEKSTLYGCNEVNYYFTKVLTGCDGWFGKYPQAVQNEEIALYS